MKVIVAFSGGKDSQACLIWAIKEYGKNNVMSVFCDTGWENPATYIHIDYVIRELDINHTTIKSNKYDGFIDMSLKKKRFPSTKARFCTEELKSKPMIDFILDTINDHCLIIQGIRKDESSIRFNMEKQCTFFKYYFEPYGYHKKGKKKDKPKYHTHRKKDVIAFKEKYADDILRPIFNWTAQETIHYIRENGQYPNPLYEQGFSRVGCFPCIMCRQGEIKQMINRYPESIEQLKQHEMNLGRSFFPPDYIPKWASTGVDKSGKKFPWVIDVEKYIRNKNLTEDIFNKPTSCMSFYGLCE